MRFATVSKATLVWLVTVTAASASAMFHAMAVATMPPALVAGQWNSLPVAGSDVPVAGLVWEIRKNSATQATSTTPNQWIVGLDAGQGSFRIFVPTTAVPAGQLIATGFEVRFDDSGTGKSATFSASNVANPNQPPSEPAPVPGWAESQRASLVFGAAESGPSSALSVDLADGSSVQSPHPDLVSKNPVGPLATYRRYYRSLRGVSGSSTPGLSEGWFDNYDFPIVAQTPSSWGYLRMTHPSGAVETLAPTLSGGLPTGGFTRVAGSPYTWSGVPSAQTGKWSSLTCRFRDETQWQFLPTSADPNLYVLTKITNEHGRYISIIRDASNANRVTSVVNDEASPLALLTMVYAGALLDRVSDAYGRKVELGHAPLGPFSLVSEVSVVDLTSVPQPTKRWGYQYELISGRPFLKSVNVLSPDGNLDSSSTLTSDAFLMKTTKVVDGNGNERSFAYGVGQTTVTAKRVIGTVDLVWTQKFNVRGLDTGVVDSLGRSSSVLYEDATNPFSPTRTTNRNGTTCTLTYLPYLGLVKTFTEPTAAGSGSLVTTFTYNTANNPAGKLIRVRQTNGPAAKSATEFDYDSNGRLLRVREPRPGTSNDPTLVTTHEYGYTGIGNLDFVKVLNASGSQVTYDWSYTDGQPENLGEPTRVTDPLGHYEQMSYAENGNVVSHSTYRRSDPTNTGLPLVAYTTNFAYNSADQVITATHPPNPLSQRAVTAYDYRYAGGPLFRVREIAETGQTVKTVNISNGKEGENAGLSGDVLGSTILRDSLYRVAGTRDGNNNLMSASYDALGNMTGMTFPLGASAVLQNFDNNGNPGRRTDALGRVTDYARNSADESLWRILQVGTSSQDVTYEYDGFKRLIRMTDQSGVTDYTYDDLDNTTSVVYKYNILGGAPRTVSYQYNPDGSRNRVNFDVSYGIEGMLYFYDDAGRTTRIDGTWTVAAADYIFYEDDSLYESKTGVFRTRLTYDHLGRVTSHQNTDRNGTVTRSTYSAIGYDGLDNPVAMTITSPAVGAVVATSGSWSGAWDARSEMTQESRTGAKPFSLPFTTDAAGSHTQARGVFYSYNANNQVTNSGYSYDAEGSATTYQGGAFAYDRENRVVSAPIPGTPNFVTSVWRADGKRASRTEGSNNAIYLYDGDQPLVQLEKIGAGATTVKYVYQQGPFGLAFQHTPGSNATNWGYDSQCFDPFGHPTHRQDKLGTQPWLVTVYDSIGGAVGEFQTSNGAARKPSDSIGAFGQYGVLSDEQLRTAASPAGLQLTASGYYDSKTGQWLSRNPGLNAYRPVHIGDAIAGFEAGFVNGLWRTMAGPVADAYAALRGKELNGRQQEVLARFQSPVRVDESNPVERGFGISGTGTGYAAGSVLGARASAGGPKGPGARAVYRRPQNYKHLRSVTNVGKYRVPDRLVGTGET
ncbi:MAG: RHS repeat protein, partial [Fimbriimonadaceae bacterium]|nr:RHS repeat protein [Fimbriimonadaceae bacterium]